MLRIQKPALAVLLKQVEDRLPVAAGRLHANQGDAVTRQPVEQPQQPGGGGRETPHHLLAPPPLARHPHTSHDRVSVHVKTGAALDQRVHCSSFARGKLDRPEEPLVKNLAFVLAATVTGACSSHATLSPGLTAPRSPGVDQTARPFSPVTSGPKGHHHSG